MASESIGEPARSLEKALADLIARSQRLPADNPDRPRLDRMIAELKAEIERQKSPGG